MLDLFGVRRGVPFRSTRGDGVPPTPSTRRVSPSQMKGGGALDFDGDALLALDDDDADDALKTDDGDALDVSFDALDMNMDAYDLGVPRCCGAFTPSTRVVSRRGGRGWFLFRFLGRSDRVETAMLRAGLGPLPHRHVGEVGTWR